MQVVSRRFLLQRCWLLWKVYPWVVNFFFFLLGKQLLSGRSFDPFRMNLLQLQEWRFTSSPRHCAHTAMSICTKIVFLMFHFIYFVFAVDGLWSRWNDWSACSRTCGIGQKSRSRTCTNPPPTNSGKDCVGSKDETQECSNRICPGLLTYFKLGHEDHNLNTEKRS